MLKKLDGKDIWVRKYEISDSKRHKNGFTVYKVISTVYSRNFPDGATKITVWKRYKDFKKLHKELETIFHQLHLKGKFPIIPHDKFFKRFDEGVIEERRKFALELLEFAATYPLLFLNKIFVKFFEDGYYPKDLLGNDGAVNNGESVEGNENVLVEEEDRNFQDCLVPERIWKDPPVHNNEESPPNASSPSFSSSSPEPVISAITSNDDTAVSTVELTDEHNASAPNPNIVTFSDSSLYSHKGKPSTSSQNVPIPYSLQDTKNIPYLGSSTSLTEDVDYLEGEFDFCNPEEARIQISASNLSLDTVGKVPLKPQKTDGSKGINSFKKYVGFNLLDFLPIFSKKIDKETTEQKLSQSFYIQEAAGHFSVAMKYESNAEYSTALESYTEGIRILLFGAQSDKDSQRRLLVKKKVEKYLSHAEIIKSKLGKNVKDCDPISDLHSESHKDDPGFVVIQDNVLPSSIKDLKSYKVVGCTFNNILIAVETNSCDGPNCFAIKVLRKSVSPLDPEKPSLIPSDIPYMVQLVKWFSTDDVIVLVLQYAAGGRLMNFVHSYQTKSTLETDEVPNCSRSLTIQGDTDNSDSTACTQLKIAENVSDEISPANYKGHKGQVIAVEVNKSKETEPEPINYFSTYQEEQPESNVNTSKMHSDFNPLTNLDTDNLLENSKALLKTVSKTLEKQRKLDLETNIENKLPELEKEPIENNQIAEYNQETRSDCFRKFSGLQTFAVENEIDDSLPPLRMLPECSLKVWAAELVIALDKLHVQGITFGDLDLHNILLGDNGHILLSYKALWNEVDSNLNVNDYSAPEIINNCLGRPLWKMHPVADWWSLGAILYFLLTGLTIQDVHPEGCIHPQTIITVPSSNVLGEPLSSSAKSLLIELLQFSPNLRLGYYGAEEIKSHPFFADFDWAAAEQPFSSHRKNN